MKALLPGFLALLGAPAAAAEPSPPVEASLLAPALRVRDCGAAQRFYETALGLTVLLSRDMSALHETMLGFPSAPRGPGIMLLCPLNASAPALRGTGQARLILSIANLDAVTARLDAARLAHGPIRSPAPGIRVLDLADRDGNELELVQNSRQH